MGITFAQWVLVSLIHSFIENLYGQLIMLQINYSS